MEDQHGAWIKKIFTIEVLNEVEDFDGDAIEDFMIRMMITMVTPILRRLPMVQSEDPNSVADTLPTDITLSHLEILENQPIGTIVGQFVVDPDPKDTHVVPFNDSVPRFPQSSLLH